MEKDVKDTIEDRIVAVFHASLSEILCGCFGKARLISTFDVAAEYLAPRNEECRQNGARSEWRILFPRSIRNSTRFRFSIFF